MNQMDHIENRIKELIEKGSDLFPGTDHRSILIAHFCESLRHFLLEEPECFTCSPSAIHVFISGEEDKLWKQQSDWQKTIYDAFIETVTEFNYKLDNLPELILAVRNSLSLGQIVFSLEETPDHEKTGAIKLSRPMKTARQPVESRTGKVLINLEGTIPLEKTITNLGRKNTNDIVVNDLRVSRMHAQIRNTREGYMVFDVGSTGGTYVNSVRITSSPLVSGDVISLAGYTFIFTHEKEDEPETDREITSDLTVRDGSEKS